MSSILLTHEYKVSLKLFSQQWILSILYADKIRHRSSLPITLQVIFAAIPLSRNQVIKGQQIIVTFSTKMMLFLMYLWIYLNVFAEIANCIYAAL